MPEALIDRMRPHVDKTIASLERKKFRIDPIAGETYSRATSIVSAAYKRHGSILERSLRERLSDCEYFSVWHEPKFQIPSEVDHVVSSRNSEIGNSLPVEMPYRPGARTLQVDAFVFDRRVRTLRAYELKRGNGDFDSGKKRSILRDVLSIQCLLKSYGASVGHHPELVESRLISYYGVRVLPDPLNIFGLDLDDHFVFRVRDPIEEVNVYFQEQLYSLLSRVSGLSEVVSASLCPTCPLHNSPTVSLH